ncbi:MAG: DUF4252 domain-containing protein [Paramuribaculum sp.]|nr:DUF4252 domain-containing protein [Paramuribaculum sp.]
MKKIIFLLLTLSCCFSGFAQGKFFEECENIPNVTTVYVSQAMMKMVSGSLSGVNSPINLSGMARKIDSLVIVNGETPEAARKVEALAGDNYSTAKGYELLMKVTDSDSKMRIVYKSIGKELYEYVLVVNEPNEASYIIITGSLTPEDVQTYSKKR